VHNNNASTAIKLNPLSSTLAIPGVVLLLSAAVLGWISYDEYQETIEQEYRFLDVHARIAQGQMGDLSHHVQQLLTRVAEELPQYPEQRRGEYSTELAKLNREIPDVKTLAVLDTRGRVVMAANPSLVGFDGSKREYFTAHLGRPIRDRLAISLPYKTVYGDYSVAFSLPILDRQDESVGIAVAGIHDGFFESVLKEIQPTRQLSSAFIVNNRGDYLYRLPDREGSIGQNATSNAAFQNFLHSGRQTTRGIGISPNDGLERMYVFRAIPDVPLNVGVSLPLYDVLTAWRRNLALRAVLFVLAAGVILRLAWTAQRRQQEALADEKYAELLIETANAMVIGVDSAGKMVVVNEATERVTGYRRVELIGRSIFDTLMPRDRFPRAWEAFLRYRESGQAARAFEAPILTRSGEERTIAWQNSAVFAHGSAPALLSFGIDMTERLQMQKLRDREEISRRLVGIQEEERRRLAIELHDRTSPNLSVLDINLKLLASALPTNAPTDLTHLIEDTSAMLEDTIASIRSVSLDFRPPLLDYAGLWPALTAYARQFTRRTGIEVKITGQEGLLRLDAEVEGNLFHIVQEAMMNCAQHSHAESLFIRQTCHGNEFILMILDDGAGFDPDACKSGRGLTMMHQRAKFIGGKLHIDSHPGKGACIAVRYSMSEATGYGQTPAAARPSASQVNAPLPATRPLAKHAVSR
jgi:PAS domain S-box-containing protein